MSKTNAERKKRGEARYVLVPLTKDVAEVVDAAAAQLGLTRANLARILILNYAALVRRKGDPLAALLVVTRKMSEAAVKPPTAADVEAGGSIGRYESRPEVEKATVEVKAGG